VNGLTDGAGDCADPVREPMRYLRGGGRTGCGRTGPAS